MAYWYKKEGLYGIPLMKCIPPPGFRIYLDTTGLCAFDEGYVFYSPHLIPIGGSAHRLSVISPVVTFERLKSFGTFMRRLQGGWVAVDNAPFSWTVQWSKKKET